MNDMGVSAREAIAGLRKSIFNNLGQPALCCRGCGATLDLADAVCDLGAQPLANALLSKDDLGQPEVHYPLRPLVCRECLLVQLPKVPSPEGIFTEGYPFFAGQSATWLTHCKRFADDVADGLELGATSRVLDIGSNDGSMLRPFRNKGIPCLGVEPCAGVAQHALMEGLPTVIDWWGTECAERLLHTDGNPTGKTWRADLVIATNVLAHVPDLADFLAGVERILAPGGTAVFEVPYVGNLLSECQFDQIYAEHHCYFSLYSLQQALHRAGLYISKTEQVAVHGGSLRVYARCPGYRGSNGPIVDALESEADAGLRDVGTYLAFTERPPQAKRAAWATLIDTCRRVGNNRQSRVVGYGASAKAAVALNYFGMGSEVIEFVADTTPAKWGKYLPGCRIPIVAPNHLATADPDVVVLLAWNWAAEAVPKIREACPRAEIISFGGKITHYAPYQAEAA